MHSDPSKKNSSNFTLWLCRIMLITAFMNAALRSGQESAVTVFRILTIVCCPFLLLRYFKLLFKEVLLMIVLLLWSLLQCSILRITSYNLLISSYIHIIFVFVIYMCMKITAHLEGDEFPEKCYHFLDRFTEFAIVLTLIEYIFSISIFPATLNRDCPSAFFWNENELCCALFTMLPLYYMQWQKTKNWFTIAKMLILFYFFYAFDCKILILATFLMIVLFLFLMSKRIKKYYVLSLILASIGLIAGIIIFFYIDFPIPTSQNTQATFSSEVRDPIMHIIRLERFYSAGSVYDRSDAIIIGLQHLKKTYGLGIGLGGSLNILDGELVTAKSMHNIFVQTIVELGVGFLIIYMIYLFKLYIRVTELSWFKLGFLISITLSSSISSGGIMSNYMFWGGAFYVFLMKHEPWQHTAPQPKKTVCEYEK